MDFNKSFWFDRKSKKFISNIDTFYYSVKLQEDFRYNSKDWRVEKFRKTVEDYQSGMDDAYYSTGSWSFCFRRGSFPPYYNFCLYIKDKFDIFFAPVVPGSGDKGENESVTSEIVVQIRSAFLWDRGVKNAFDRSLEALQSILDQFALHIEDIKENRCDFCYHTNAIQDPEAYFNIERIYPKDPEKPKRLVTHLGRADYSYKLKKYTYENDYIALGHRGSKCFVRIYLKTKEVVEMGYKPFFFYIWFFQGMISRYDLHILEEAFKMHSWSYVDVARCKFALDYLDVSPEDHAIMSMLVDQEKYNYHALSVYANKYTPELTKIINVEFQCMRRMTKSFNLLPFHDNSDQGIKSRVYDFLDNRDLITDYLTHDTMRLVDPVDSNKSRCDYCDFWKRLRGTKPFDYEKNRHNLHLTRQYSRDLNVDVRKKRITNAINSLGYLASRKPDSDVFDDAAEILGILNDNDLANYKKYKFRQTYIYDHDEIHDPIHENGREVNYKVCKGFYHNIDDDFEVGSWD